MTATITPVPSECIAYTSINDATRHASNRAYGSTCDDVLFPSATWVRFQGASGNVLANCPLSLNRCAATTPGWYSGVYPSSVGATTTGDVCFTWSTSTCAWNVSIAITNCNGYYVFQLSAPPICDARYCTI